MSIETLVNKTSNNLLGLEFKSQNYIKSKAIKLIANTNCKWSYIVMVAQILLTALAK